MRLNHVGGLWHWRVGRLGGSCYVARKPAAAIRREPTYPALLAGYDPQRDIAAAWERSPYLAGYVAIAISAGAMMAAWFAVGIASGFI